MNRIVFTFLFLIITLAIFSFKFSVLDSPVYADEIEDQLNAKQQEIKELETKLAETKKQSNTLKSQLNIIDSQAKVTGLKIEETNLQIAKLEREITDLDGRITRISSSVDSLSEILLNRIVQTYKYGNVDTIDLLFSSHGFADLIERLKYIQVAQANDKKVLYQLQATKGAYKDQKQDKEVRQLQAEKLNKDLADYKTQLDQERKAKDALLRVTKNDEAVYQAKLQAALAEQQAILSLSGNAKHEIADGPVSKGAQVGHYILGVSACSSGSHLHFEVRQNGSIMNPAGSLINHSINWDNDPDGSFAFTGSWDWPLNDPISLSQGYGMTYWASHGWYGGGPHTGIDIYSSSSEVKAVHDGQLSHGGVKCGGGTLHYKRVDHGDGYSSFYLHVI